MKTSLSGEIVQMSGRRLLAGHAVTSSLSGESVVKLPSVQQPAGHALTLSLIGEIVRKPGENARL